MFATEAAVPALKVSCPSCQTLFRVDSRKLPEGGARARCSVCSDVFLVRAPQQPPPAATRRAEPAPPSGSGPPQPSPPRAPAFGSTDAQARARRLARALISDIVIYHPARRDKSLEDGTLKQEFREEIRKSWEEYVGQVGVEAAQSTSHFRDALNDILAKDQPLF